MRNLIAVLMLTITSNVFAHGSSHPPPAPHVVQPATTVCWLNLGNTLINYSQVSGVIYEDDYKSLRIYFGDTSVRLGITKGQTVDQAVRNFELWMKQKCETK